MKTKSTGEAMELLCKTRAQLISAARKVADELINSHGETHGRKVYEVMSARGLLVKGVPEYWLGLIFRPKMYEWTGEWVVSPMPDGTAQHAMKHCKVWRHKR